MARRQQRRRWWAMALAAVAAGLGLAALAGKAAQAWGDRRYDADLAAAIRLLALGRADQARDRLDALARARPDRGEALLTLGDCESRLGRPDAALDAWTRVPAGSPCGPAAALRAGRAAVDQDRFAAAEAALAPLARGGGPKAGEARDLLLKLLWRQARFPEVAAQIEDQWRDLGPARQGDPAAAVELLRAHLALDLDDFPADEVEAGLRRSLDRVRAPADARRIRLALARWAIQAGRPADAAPILDALEREDPSDPAATRVRLRWVRASGQPALAGPILARIPADGATAAEVAGWQAWFAFERGDPAAEAAALDRLVAANPHSVVAWTRLAELRPGSAPDLRARAEALGAAARDYRLRFRRDELADDPGAMARLADQLGRQFEARAFAALAAARGPADPALRAILDRPPVPAPGPDPVGRTLAELIGPAPARPAAAAERPAVPRFDDVASAAGLAFTFASGATPARQLPEVMAGGVGLLDYDGDGHLDVYAVQGGPFPPPPGPAPMGDRLFRNRGDGTFEDATARAGLDRLPGGYGHGVAAGDVDNDGDPDLFVTRWRGYALFRNNGDGTFRDATADAGFGGDRDWPTSAAFADLDGDGDLDLYVCHYLRWDADDPRICPDPEGRGNRSCDPRQFAALPDHAFRNDGAGRFEEVAIGDGYDRDGRGLGVVAADLDGDGKVDLFVANDGSANFLLHNLGGFRFEEVALASGVAGNASGTFQAGMGVAAGDLNGDGRADLVVTNFLHESMSLFENLGGPPGTLAFGDRAAASGLSAATRPLLGFGVAILDGNDDGRPDLATANGHVNDDRPRFPFAMPCQLLLHGPRDRARFAPADPAVAGPAWSAPRLGRGLAAGDLDGDGRVDLAVVALDEPLALLRNRGPAGPASPHSVTFRLEGTRSNRDGVGTRVAVTAGGRTQTAWRVGGGSYLSAGDGRLHFGLGPAARVEAVEVRWPSGRVDAFRDLAADAAYLIREGDPAPRPLPR